MKEILGWIKWCWNNWETWQRWFIFAMFLNFVSVFVERPYDYYVNACGIAIVVAFFFKWAIYDSVRSSWKNYVKHRNELFQTIKDSDNANSHR